MFWKIDRIVSFSNTVKLHALASKFFKKDTLVQVFSFWIFRNFEEPLFYETSPVAASDYMKRNLKINLVKKIWHGVTVGPGPRDLGPRDPGTRDPRPPSKFKSGTRDHLKFKSGTPGPPSKIKSRTPGPTLKFKSVIPFTFLSWIHFFRIFNLLFLLNYFCVFFK